VLRTLDPEVELGLDRPPLTAEETARQLEGIISGRDQLLTELCKKKDS